MFAWKPQTWGLRLRAVTIISSLLFTKKKLGPVLKEQPHRVSINKVGPISGIKKHCYWIKGLYLLLCNDRVHPFNPRGWISVIIFLFSFVGEI